jgi:hypothetical protein
MHFAFYLYIVRYVTLRSGRLLDVELQGDITDPTDSLAVEGARLEKLSSSPLLSQAKAICRSKPYLRYSLNEVVDELEDEQFPIQTDVYIQPTVEDIANVRNIYAFFGCTAPLLNQLVHDVSSGSSVSDTFLSDDESAYSDHFDPADPTAGRVHTPSEDDDETSMSIISFVYVESP